MKPCVPIAGVSTGGLAESAGRAGYDVIGVDGFGDLGLRARARAVFLARDAHGRFSARLATRAARRLRYDAVTYVAPLENHPSVVRALAGRRRLWGNAPGVLTPARDPLRVVVALTARGILPPNVYTRRHHVPPPAPGRRRWLVQPPPSGGGHGTTAWRGRGPAARTYLAERVGGGPAPVGFAS